MPVLISVVMITLMGMITSVGVPSITNTFQLTSQQAPWINTVNTMASAVLAPVMGWIGDRRGIKTQLLVGILCVFISNIASAFAPGFIFFCITRFVGGIGLAAAFPASMSYISENFPADKKVGSFAILSACICLGSGFGPTIVGMLLSVTGWRELFLYSEIVTALLFFYVLLGVKNTGKANTARRLDLPGMLLLFVGVGALLSLLTLSTQLSWSHPLMLCLLAVSLLGIAFFYRHEKGCDIPMVDVDLLLSPRFLVPASMGLFIYAFKCYCCTAIPYYFTMGLGVSSSLSGLWLTVFFLAGFPLSFFIGRLNRRFTTRVLAVAGAVSWVLGMAMLVLSSDKTPMWYYFLAAAIPSVGIAILGGMPNACALKVVPAEKSGSVSGTISTISNLGAALISALLIPYLSVFGNVDGKPDYLVSFPKTSAIMLGLLLLCLTVTFFFPKDKSVSG